MPQISELAHVDPAAHIDDDVRIGPFCYIGPHVEIGAGCELMNNVTLRGHTRVGRQNVFYPNVVVGVAPQDLKYQGGPTETIVGDRNVFREHVTVHRGTELGGGRTKIGSDGLFMVATHIAHDCVVGDRVLLGNQTQLAGHVVVEDGAVVSALVGLHHFVTVGRYSYVAGLTPVRRDVPPFMKFAGDPNAVRAVNEEGLKRNGFSGADIESLKHAYRQLFRRGAVTSAVLNELEQQDGLNGHVKYLCEFLRQSMSSRFFRYRETLRRDGQAL